MAIVMREVEITSESLHRLIDRLPECEHEVVYYVLLAHLKKHDPLYWNLMVAHEDDEEEIEETEEERLAVEEAREDIKAGRWITQEELERRSRELP